MLKTLQYKQKAFSGYFPCCTLHSVRVISMHVNIAVMFQEPDAFKPLESFTLSYQGFPAAPLAPYAMLAKDTAQLHICTHSHAKHTHTHKNVHKTSIAAHTHADGFYWY